MCLSVLSCVWEQQTPALWQLWLAGIAVPAEPYLLLVLDAVRGLLELPNFPDNV